MVTAPNEIINPGDGPNFKEDLEFDKRAGSSAHNFTNRKLFSQLVKNNSKSRKLPKREQRQAKEEDGEESVTITSSEHDSEMPNERDSVTPRKRSKPASKRDQRSKPREKEHDQHVIGREISGVTKLTKFDANNVTTTDLKQAYVTGSEFLGTKMTKLYQQQTSLHIEHALDKTFTTPGTDRVLVKNSTLQESHLSKNEHRD